MRDLLTCVLALTWVLVVIRQMGTRRYPRETADHIDRDFRDLVERDLVDRAHRGGHTPCPVHGTFCRRKAEARRTGLSQTDEDVARRASLSDGIKSITLGYSDDDGQTWFTKPGGVDGPSTH